MIYLMGLLWAAAAAALAIAIGRAVTRRHEGVSVVRLAIPVAVLAAATALLAANAPLITGSGTSGPAARTPERRLAEVERRSRELSAQLQETRRTEARLRQRLAVPQGKAAPTAPVVETAPEVAPDGPQRLLLVLMLLLLAADFAVLFMADRLIAMLPFGRANSRREEQLKALEELTGLVWGEDYRGALAKASEILELKLRQSEILDLFYLRSYAGIQVYAFPKPDESEAFRNDLLADAVRDLREVVEIAPKRGPALYLLALALGFAGRDDEALAMFARARPRLGTQDLSFAHNESVCLLRSAERHLIAGDNEAAEACFAQVAGLGTLTSSVLQVRIKIGLIDLRTAMSRRAIAAAESTLEKIIGFAGLTREQKATMEVIRIEINARNALAQDDPARAAAEADRFVADHLPPDLPALDDDVVDEPFSAFLDADLAFPRSVYSNILFIQAIARCRLAARHGPALTEEDIAGIAEPLLRALQIQPRQRELLAAIGGLYYWMRPDLRAKAREWVEAAVVMGSESKFARMILAHDRAVEAERRGVLELFRSTSARFLRDPSLTAELRSALIEELSRFQEFEPMLVSIQGRPEQEPQEPTVAILRERARHLSDLMESVTRRGDAGRSDRLGTLRAEYARSLAALEESAQSLEALERSVVRELGSVLTLN